MDREVPELLEGFQLEGKAALVTGGSMGIGKASALLMARAGASVCIVARDAARVAAATDEIRSTGATAIGIAGSVTDPEVRERSVRACIDQLGSLDILVNNAGGSQSRTLLFEMEDEDLRRLVEINLEVPLKLSRLAWEQWMAEHGGSIVNVTSMAGVRPNPGYAWYGATKAALAHMTRALALELAPTVRVNSIAPGAIATEMLMANTTPEHQQLRATTSPLKRLGDPDNLAYAILLLASPASAFTTGQQLMVDGGQYLLGTAASV